MSAIRPVVQSRVRMGSRIETITMRPRGVAGTTIEMIETEVGVDLAPQVLIDMTIVGDGILVVVDLDPEVVLGVVLQVLLLITTKKVPITAAKLCTSKIKLDMCQ